MINKLNSCNSHNSCATMSNNETKSSCREGKFRELRKGIVGDGGKDMQGMEERICRGRL